MLLNEKIRSQINILYNKYAYKSRKKNKQANQIHRKIKSKWGNPEAFAIFFNF
jgi:hypothetical protein